MHKMEILQHPSQRRALAYFSSGFKGEAGMIASAVASCLRLRISLITSVCPLCFVP